MTLTEALKTAYSVQFTTPEDHNEPAMVAIIFRDRSISGQSYKTMKELFKNGDLRLEFKENKSTLTLSFVEIKSDILQTSISIRYEKIEFQDFTDFVTTDMQYVVIFGFKDNDGILAVSNVINQSFSPLVFDGYKIL
jgi:hypothetical protein